MKPSHEQKREHIIRRMQTDLSTDAPADVITSAKTIFRVRAAEPKASPVKRILAVMSLDLAPNQLAFGERSASGGQARQMLFESGNHAIDIRITPAGKGFDLRGQVLGDGFENGMITIDGEKTIEARLDAAAGFSLTGLKPGDYSITVKGTDSEIFIEKLALQ